MFLCIILLNRDSVPWFHIYVIIDILLPFNFDFVTSNSDVLTKTFLGDVNSLSAETKFCKVNQWLGMPPWTNGAVFFNIVQRGGRGQTLPQFFCPFCITPKENVLEQLFLGPGTFRGGRCELLRVNHTHYCDFWRSHQTPSREGVKLTSTWAGGALGELEAGWIASRPAAEEGGWTSSNHSTN